MSADSPFVLGITGATGMLFLHAFLKVAREENISLHAIISQAGRRVLELESGVEAEALPGIERWFAADDFAATPSSGSSCYRGMVILPCTMGTLAAVASGFSINLIHRAAAVALKERRRLVLAVRETPLGRAHLQNMLTAHDAGAIICPTMPSYYLKPASLEEAAETWAWRLLDQLDPELEITGRRRWK
ncbi:UbiX family flavin prenyltransferase [Desulforhopalus vacuolatus]|uniref:UbiX family flavin prenyltransferase n=1 Tax=Desulforhopalus vacuolatus TaxID=40414 RepID=UPI0019655671|nr:UbiX family flavin prenyltransferase [Desulforhopalus vacuolatus]MBM9520674.1 UbiX family flavin prenyltransferase [Desulforhopalus vacuolatus]